MEQEGRGDLVYFIFLRIHQRDAYVYSPFWLMFTELRWRKRKEKKNLNKCMLSNAPDSELNGTACEQERLLLRSCTGVRGSWFPPFDHSLCRARAVCSWWLQI
jgi:hypothetical protein